MTWQDVAVACIVTAAVAFLVRKILGFGRAARSPTTFIPIGQLRKRSRTDVCH